MEEKQEEGREDGKKGGESPTVLSQSGFGVSPKGAVPGEEATPHLLCKPETEPLENKK